MVNLLNSQIYPLHPIATLAQPFNLRETLEQEGSLRSPPRHKICVQSEAGGGVHLQSPSSSSSITQVLRPQLEQAEPETMKNVQGLLRELAGDLGKPEFGWFPSRSPQGGEETSPLWRGSSSLTSSGVIPCCILRPHFWMCPFLTHNGDHLQARTGCSHQEAAHKLPEH